MSRSSENDPPIVRWLFPIVLAVLCVAWVLYAKLSDRFTPAVANVYMMSALGTTVWTIAGWTAIFAPWPNRWRRLPLIMLVFGTVLFFGVFRLRGFDGDLWPKFAWRWWSDAPTQFAEVDTPSEEQLDDLTAKPAAVPGFLGPDRTGHYTVPPLQTDWTSEPPRKLWERDVGAAWSSFAVQENRVVTQEQRDLEELVTCYDLETGQPLWEFSYEGGFSSLIAGAGPRATPAIHGHSLVAVGSQGDVHCLDVRTGELLWKANCLEDTDGAVPYYGYSASPLVVNDLVVLAGGGPHPDGQSAAQNLIAYRIADGSIAWRGYGDACSYSSPVLMELVGHEQIVVLNETSCSGHEPATGDQLWSTPWPGTNAGAGNIAQPVKLADNQFLLSKGYGVGCAAYEVKFNGQDWSIREVYRSRHMKTKFTSAVLIDDTLYGLDEGILMAVDAADGRKLWKDGRYGHGQVIALHEDGGGDYLLVQAEQGYVALLNVNRQGLTEVARLPALQDTTWNYPVVVENRLLVRNAEQVQCYALPTKPQPE